MITTLHRIEKAAAVLRFVTDAVSVRVLSVTHGNPSLEEISLSDEQFWPIYPSLAEIPPVTDSTSDVSRDPSLMECTATRYCTVDLLWYQLQRSFSI